MELPHQKLKIKIKQPFGRIKITNTCKMEGVRFRLPNVKIEETITYVTQSSDNIYRPPCSDKTPVTLKISNIPLHLKRQDIYNRLNSLNIVIRNLNMVHDKEKNFRGYAYLHLQDMESAKIVIKHLDRQVICNQSLAVEIAPTYDR